MEKIDAIGVIEDKEEAVKSSENTKYQKFKITLEGAEKPLTFSCWDYQAGTKVKKGEKVKFYYTEKESIGFEDRPVIYRNIQSIGTLDKYEKDPNLGSDEELAKQAPPESIVSRKEIVHKESSGGRGEPSSLSTNQSIVRQVLYKVASELLVKATPAKEVNEYVKELEQGFYGG